jgi:DNA polymerase I-like protein with 3'-5' exonuclease and polymerase domains
MAVILNNADVGLVRGSEEKLWAYNAYDCCITRELYDTIEPMLDDTLRHTYDFERGMIGPALTMVRRGLRVDQEVVQSRLQSLTPLRAKLIELLDTYANAIWDKELNHNSPIQLKKFLYECLGLPKTVKYDKGKEKISTDREALEGLRNKYPRARPVVDCILALRDIDKQTSVLNSAVCEWDGRMRTSYNVAGTETGRWSSSESAFWNGTNMQNITADLREIFIADDGYKLFYADLDQAESRVVAYITGDDGYINACESGDLHTTVVQMVWPSLPWTGDPDEDRRIADQQYYLHFTYRDMCKRAGHGTNYGLQAGSLQRQLKIDLKDAHRFQLMYYGGDISYASLARWHKQDSGGGFDQLIDEGTTLGVSPKKGELDKRLVRVAGAFPGIRAWHNDVAQKIQTTGQMTTPLGRRRQFWGRLTDATTLREAIANEPQSTVGDLLNIGLYRIWNELEPRVQLLGQVHDAILGQAREETFDKDMQDVLDCMHNPLVINGRSMVIPTSAEVGYSWGKEPLMEKWSNENT